MNKLFLPMLKEEWRAHSAFFGNFMFAMFPLMILLSCAAATLFLPEIIKIIPMKDILLILTYMFVMFGISAGSFGLLGREAMNRRFGHASLIAFSSRTLPVSEKEIFFSFILKEFAYYFVYWILPFPLGYLIGTSFAKILIINAYYLLASFTVSFLIGMAFSFILSTVFVNTGKKLFFLILFIIISATIVLSRYLIMIPTYSFIIERDHTLLIPPVLLSLLFSGISILFLKIDFPVEKNPWKESLSRLRRLPGFSNISSKDMIDLWRSDGGIGKMLFTLLLPSIALWKIIEIFTSRFVPVNFLAMFTISFAMLTPTIYNWLTEFDTYGNYAFLPVLPTDLIRSKFRTYLYIDMAASIGVIVAACVHGDTSNLLSSILCFIGISIWSTAVTIYLTGLTPNVSLYNPKIFCLNILFNLPVTLGYLILSIFSTQYVSLCIFMVLPALLLMKMSYAKWDRVEQATY